ncbi:hypothetical protein ONE63_004380 [Megalurothrips usitatus]|uniref:VPS37 C-terminal domain-containing protein n=1 Tax=Megalurothrips usitatus TaxID=439358 RepID=A0AAV7X2M9_9NEOP|nr:hypothetical protein ONE63_004380 [Megalurothrips usitatus]
MYSNHSDGDLSSVLAIFATLSNNELKEFLDDDGKLDSFLRDQKQVKDLEDLETEKEMVLASNRSIAEFNLSRQRELAEGKRRLQQSSEEGQKLLESIESITTQLKDKTGSTNAETVLALLQTAAAEMEEESEKIAEQFLEGEIDVDTFLDKFQTSRKLMHLRRVKSDKMSDLLNNKQAETQQGPTTAPYPTFPTGGVSYYPPAPPVGGAPYPMGPFNMPLPGGYPMPRY